MRAAKLSALLVTVSSAALACPVCGVGPEYGQGAYLFMSGILSALPLLAIGSVVAWVALRVRAAAKADEAEAQALRDNRVTRYGSTSQTPR